MNKKDDVESPPPPARSWTHIDSYLWGARRRGSAASRKRSAKPARDPEPERPWLNTLPFLVLIAGLVLITIAIVSLAMPGALRQQGRPAPQQQAERGTAPPGWLETQPQRTR
jgi:ABC-type Fe3+ transport system permease subunit